MSFSRIFPFTVAVIPLLDRVPPLIPSDQANARLQIQTDVMQRERMKLADQRKSSFFGLTAELAEMPEVQRERVPDGPARYACCCCEALL